MFSEPCQKERSALLQDIRENGKEQEYPGDDLINGCGCGREECNAITAYFAKKDWREIRFEEMRKSCSNAWDTPFAFLHPLAVRYFLPAFLQMYLQNQASLDVLASHLLRSLCPHQGWRSQIERLSISQEFLVLRFLRHVEKWEAEYKVPVEKKMLTEGIQFWSSRLEKAEATTIVKTERTSDSKAEGRTPERWN
jgi:hypothetical protein